MNPSIPAAFHHSGPSRILSSLDENGYIGSVIGASVRFRLPDKTMADLVPGDVIGRVWTAAAWIADPRVSEAHALVSLRGAELMLVALCGPLEVDGRPKTEVVLEPEMVIELAEGVSVEVESVTLPDEVFAIEGEGCPQQILLPVVSILTRPRVRLADGEHPDAMATVWSDGTEWKVRIDDVDQPIETDVSFIVDGRPFRVVPVSVSESEAGAASGGVHAPMTLEAYGHTVHILRKGETTLKISGPQARMLSTLVSGGGPMSWESVARVVWAEEADRAVLRQKWDVALARLRRRLKVARIRPNLVRADGKGNFEIVGRSEDSLLDKT